MKQSRYFPDINQLSVLSATILLMYALSPFINIPPISWEVTIPGVDFFLSLNFKTVVSFMVALLAAVGTDWLLRSHPKLDERSLFQHGMIPALTAWVIGIPLNILPVGWQWWVVLGFGGILLILVFIAEYMVIDLAGSGHALATLVLISVSFALYIFLLIAIHRAGLRLYLELPVLGLTLGLVVLRTLYLRLDGKWYLVWTIGICLIVGQIIVGLHYLPVSPVGFGLFVLGPAYALTSLAGSIEEKQNWQTIWIEPAIVLVIIIGAGIIFRGG